MKKALLISGILLAVLAVAGTAFVVYAQNDAPPVDEYSCPGWEAYGQTGFRHGRGMGFFNFNNEEGYTCPGSGANGAFGPMHEAMTAALAEATGLSVEEINERIAAGEHHFEIALDAGLTEEELSALMQSVHESVWEEDDGFYRMPHGHMYYQDGEDFTPPAFGGGCHGGRGRWAQPEL